MSEMSWQLRHPEYGLMRIGRADGEADGILDAAFGDDGFEKHAPPRHHNAFRASRVGPSGDPVWRYASASEGVHA